MRVEEKETDREGQKKEVEGGGRDDSDGDEAEEKVCGGGRSKQMTGRGRESKTDL